MAHESVSTCARKDWDTLHRYSRPGPALPMVWANDNMSSQRLGDARTGEHCSWQADWSRASESMPVANFERFSEEEQQLGVYHCERDSGSNSCE